MDSRMLLRLVGSVTIFLSIILSHPSLETFVDESTTRLVMLILIAAPVVFLLGPIVMFLLNRMGFLLDRENIFRRYIEPAIKEALNFLLSLLLAFAAAQIVNISAIMLLGISFDYFLFQVGSFSIFYSFDIFEKVISGRMEKAISHFKGKAGYSD